jgi:CHAD domain-containing protein
LPLQFSTRERIVAYSLKPGRPVAVDIARIVRKQAHRAVEELRAVGSTEEAEEIHRARRHLKKAAAALRLVKPVIDGGFARAATRLRAASHLIAPIADASALVDCIDRLANAKGFHAEPDALRDVRAGLVERSARWDRKAALNAALPRAVRLLERGDPFGPDLSPQVNGFHAVAPGLLRSARRARRSMHAVSTAPTLAGTHRWRRRVKDLWYQVRLLDRRCGNQLRAERAGLELLDGLLGEWRNIALVEEAILDEPRLSRDATAQLFRQLRRRKGRLRQRALALAARTLGEKPEDFVRRIEALWRHARRSRSTRPGTARCPHV